MFHLLSLSLVCASSAQIFSVLDYGADPGGERDSGVAVRAAVTALSLSGGGILYFPPGSYTSTPFNLTSNTVMLLDYATLSANGNMSAFSLVPPLPSYGEGRDKLPNDLNGRFQPFIGVYYASNVTITTNSTGVIDGNGPVWWYAKAQNKLNNTPPHLLETYGATDFSLGAPPDSPVNALLLVDSPFWNVHLYTTRDAYIHDLSIQASPLEGNTDGVDPDSSRDVLIERLIYAGGDDGVAVKSGWDEAGIKYGVPSVNITVRHSSFSTRACCVCIGSEMSGGAENISAYNISCTGVGNGMYVKSSPGRGGYVRNFSMTDSTFTGVGTGFGVMLTYGDNPQPPLQWNASDLPIMENFLFARIKGVGVQTAGSLSGNPGGGSATITITGVRVEDVDLGVTKKGWLCENVTGTSSNVNPPICAAIGGGEGL